LGDQPKPLAIGKHDPLLRTYHLLEHLRRDSGLFRRNEDAILAATNLVVFVFAMTGIVYATQHGSQPGHPDAGRRPVLHRDLAHDDGLRRHHTAGLRRAGCSRSS
jgi:hypothetical protein